jgi:hypothetical protein
MDLAFKLWSERSNIELASSICPALMNEWYLRKVRSGHVIHHQPATVSITVEQVVSIDTTVHRGSFMSRIIQPGEKAS